jgi:hypothetical protein
MSELYMLGNALEDGEYEDARVHLLALAYKLNRLRRLLDESDVDQVKYELETLIGVGE